LGRVIYAGPAIELPDSGFEWKGKSWQQVTTPAIVWTHHVKYTFTFNQEIPLPQASRWGMHSLCSLSRDDTDGRGSGGH